MNILATVDGREAIPVRALRFALWHHPPNPATLPGPAFIASSLRDLANRDGKTHGPLLAKTLADRQVIDVLGGHWLACYNRIMDAQHKPGASDRPPTHLDLLLLPSMFLWREDFEKAVLSRGFFRLIPTDQFNDPAWRPWTYDPPIPDELREAVMEGFEQCGGPQPVAPGPVPGQDPGPEPQAATPGTVPLETPQDPGPEPQAAMPGTGGTTSLADWQDKVDTTGMVAWQAVVLENWTAIVTAYGAKPTARSVAQWVKKHGPRDVIPEKQDNRDALTWVDTYRVPHNVLVTSIGKRLSEWRRAGKIP